MNRKTLTSLTAAVLAAAGLVAFQGAGAAEADGYDAIIDSYEEIRLALLDDRLAGVAAEAAALAETVSAVAADFDAARAGVPAATGDEAEALLLAVASAATDVAVAQDLSAARGAFGDLTEPLLRYREIAGDTEVRVAYCPMAGKSWLQRDGETLGNPYYGQSMARCGTFQEDRSP